MGIEAGLALAALLLTGATYVAVAQPWVLPLELVEPGATGRRVVSSEIFGNYYPAPGPGRHPAILLVGGSEGGIGRHVSSDARALQAEGFTVFNISFFRAAGQREALIEIPLETFDHALEWLKQQPAADPEKLAMVGNSKGAEAALLVATRRKDLRAVVAGVPSSYVWPGFDWSRMGAVAQSSWSSGGIPLPALPLGPFSFSGGLRSVYESGLARRAEHPEAAIPIERSQAAVLLVCGGRDQVWPSCEMSLQLKERAEAHGGPRLHVISYPAADHGAFGSPGPAPRRYGFSPEPQASREARADGWPKVVRFLKSSMEQPASEAPLGQGGLGSATPQPVQQ